MRPTTGARRPRTSAHVQALWAGVVKIVFGCHVVRMQLCRFGQLRIPAHRTHCIATSLRLRTRSIHRRQHRIFVVRNLAVPHLTRRLGVQRCAANHCANERLGHCIDSVEFET